MRTTVNSAYEIHTPLRNNLNRLSIGFSYLKNEFGHNIEDCIVVLNLYVTVERVLKQLISSFDTTLALMFKGKHSSTK